MQDPDLLPEEIIPQHLVDPIVGLAHEGVPVRAIARATKQASVGVRNLIEDAVNGGKIVSIPRDDWPPVTPRDERVPAFVKANRVDDDNLIYSCVRMFKLTRLQASLFAVIVLRNEVSKDTLHQIIESRRPANKDETDPKMVDVVICNLRKRLKPFNLTIKTLWACGYYMDPVQRKEVLKMIGAYLNGGDDDAEGSEDGKVATGTSPDGRAASGEEVEGEGD